MGKTLKIVFMILLILLVAFSIMIDMPFAKSLRIDLDLGLYLKLVSLFGLIIAALIAWAHKSEVVSSQKYTRADEVLAQAEETLERKKEACKQMEKRLQAKFDEKEKGLDDQINLVRQAYQKRLNLLKEQNMELKETVGKLMRTLKRERQEQK